jgi:nicotinamidase-related amidase
MYIIKNILIKRRDANMKTQYSEIVDINSIGKLENTKSLNDLLKKANEEGLNPASKNPEKTILVAIDVQNDFMDNGALGVPGAHKDVERLTNFIYNNMDKLAQIAVSIDTHTPHQIFHPSWWVDNDGNNPPPFTVISVADLDANKWKAVINPIASRNYVEQLEKLGKQVLCIWPYHCIQGTVGSALENQFTNMVYFHSVAKKSQTIRLVKGTDPLSEMYGIIKPEYSAKNYINLDFLNKLETFEKIIISGEAKSHCVLESIKQILEYYASKPEITKKIYILEDCMSVIPGFEKQTEDAFNTLKQQYGVNIVNSTDDILN